MKRVASPRCCGTDEQRSRARSLRTRPREKAENQPESVTDSASGRRRMDQAAAATRVSAPGATASAGAMRALIGGPAVPAATGTPVAAEPSPVPPPRPPPLAFGGRPGAHARAECLEVFAASYFRRLNRRSTARWIRARSGWKRAATTRVDAATASSDSRVNGRSATWRTAMAPTYAAARITVRAP